MEIIHRNRQTLFLLRLGMVVHQTESGQLVDPKDGGLLEHGVEEEGGEQGAAEEHSDGHWNSGGSAAEEREGKRERERELARVGAHSEKKGRKGGWIILVKVGQLDGFDGRTHGHVTVPAEHGHQEGAQQLVDTLAEPVQLAHELAKGPLALAHFEDQQWQVEDHEKVDDGQSF